MKTLVIIDMQDFYLEEGSIVGSKDSLEISILKSNIVSLIQKFMDNNYPIILVEYGGSGRTNKYILDAISGYDNCYNATKYKCDGSAEIIEIINTLNLPKNINVCGVYSDQCVKDSVIGLLKKDSSIEIEFHEECVWPFTNDLNVGYGIDHRVKSLCFSKTGVVPVF